jgi:hypothetical protein
MEFLLFLTPAGSEIYSLISQKIKVTENSPICQEHKIFGWYDSVKNTATICTDTIKEIDPDNVEYWTNETLYHESVHIAQDCKSERSGSNLWFQPFGMDKDKMPLNHRRLSDLSVSNKAAPTNNDIEHEALFLEDKPHLVKYVVNKYCF